MSNIPPPPAHHRHPARAAPASPHRGPPPGQPRRVRRPECPTGDHPQDRLPAVATDRPQVAVASLPPGGMQGGGMQGGVMAAPSWAFKKFQEDIGTWLLLAVIPLIVLGPQSRAASMSGARASSRPNSNSFFPSLLVNAITTIVGFALFRLQHAADQGRVGRSRGEQKPSLKHMTDMTDIGPYLALSAILGLAVGIGTFFCYIPASSPR